MTMMTDDLSPSIAEPKQSEGETNQATAENPIDPTNTPSDTVTAVASAEETATANEPTPESSSIPAEPLEMPNEPAQKPEPTPAPSAPAPTSTPEVSDEDLFAAAMAELDSGPLPGENYRKLSKGDRVEATVIQVEHDRVFVDLGTKSEGVVPLAELSVEPLESAHGQVQIGDKINVVVLRPEGSGGEGNPIVSKKKADFEEVWNRILDKFNSGETITAPVVNRVKGGLEVDLGVRGFVPATHVGNGKLRNIEKFVGQPLELKIIEVDRERKKVVLSNKQAEDEKRDKVKETLFQSVKPGDVVDGVVRRLTDYGAFIDLGGIDGLLHISEMSWMRINHPKEVLKEGQELKVMVLRLDEGNSKISLGLRQVLPDPWKLIKENYRIGQKITCTIGRLVQSGAFIKLPEGAEAFLPVSEISNRRIGKPSDVLQEGQEVEVAVLDLRPDERRMVLSLRGAGTQIDVPADYEPGPMREDDGARRGLGGKKKKRRGSRHDDDDFDSPLIGRGGSSSGATIGERLGMLKGLLRPETGEDEPEADSESDSDEE
ncbi:MAG: 30S ribosomal protein S1 [Armatimonadetes bacterium]|nr:30S ribosomal protein S1 [Armatimonadota bacterium]